MFDIAPSEFLLIAIVAIVVIGPKDLPMALRAAGRWIARVRRVSNHFKSGIETMIREAEMEEMERKWREQNAAIMAANPNPEIATETATATANDPPLHADHAPVMMPLATPHADHAPIDPLVAAHGLTDPHHAVTAEAVATVAQTDRPA
ncbi:Sec-independent protein translocase protein TatB [Novosphingobium sp.]|uniref:Sec-independent protein translocase protein TatB n=1 Tax=Novosphingobium sp. TaxID=1874826 RepID=UPI003340B836